MKELQTNVLIIGGGTAGCYAAIRLGQEENTKVLVVEKANIKRSGCLAAGVNALNAYISEGHVPEDYVDYARKDGEGIVRDDLLLTMSQRLNEVTEDLEKKGLVILKDDEGKYVTRGWRNLKINGENIKPILAKATGEQKNVTVLNHVNITDLKTENVDGRQVVTGAFGFSVNSEVFYDITADVVLVATGGAAGIYRPNNPGFSRHKMWYPPFNTGAGFAFGFKAGAEMTTFENRFVALRCKDTIAPTGTIAQGVRAKQVNSEGEIYETKYGITTPQRIWGTVEESKAGRGPCYLKTDEITDDQEEDLYKAYLNMAPAQTLKWLEAGKGPSKQNVEIEGTEPYIVGGHTASGYWVDTKRETTVKNLYAAGDVTGGAPQKYVTGALAEAAIAAESIAARLKELASSDADNTASGSDAAKAKEAEYRKHLSKTDAAIDWEQVEEAMQKVMDEYAGGIATNYKYNDERLKLADEKIVKLQELAENLPAKDSFDLLHVYEVKERLVVCRILIAHLLARKETRWHIFGEHAEYPEQVASEESYVNTHLENGQIVVTRKPLVKEAVYEHQN